MTKKKEGEKHKKETHKKITHKNKTEFHKHKTNTKTSHSSKTHHFTNTKKISAKDLNHALLENFVSLQKVITNLALKFDELSSNISRLLKLIEESAKSFSENYPEGTGGVDKEFLKKLDSLLNQNKTISKAITMMEERIRKRAEPPRAGIIRRF